MSTTTAVRRTKPWTRSKLPFKALVAVMYLFLLAPLIIVFIISFSSNPYLSFPPKGFTLEWYEALPEMTEFISGMKVTLITSSISTIIVIAVGVPAALALERYSFRGKAAISGFLLSPLLIPTIVLAVGLVLVLGPMGLLNTYASIVIGHVSITLPYIVRTAMMSIRTADTSCEEAARVLGATSFQTFRRVTVPLIAPGVLGGAIMAFIVSFDELVISLFVAQSQRATLPVEIMNYVEGGADAAVASLSVVLIVFSGIVIVAVERLIGLKNAF